MREEVACLAGVSLAGGGVTLSLSLLRRESGETDCGRVSEH